MVVNNKGIGETSNKVGTMDHSNKTGEISSKDGMVVNSKVGIMVHNKEIGETNLKTINKVGVIISSKVGVMVNSKDGIMDLNKILEISKVPHLDGEIMVGDQMVHQEEITMVGDSSKKYFGNEF